MKVLFVGLLAVVLAAVGLAHSVEAGSSPPAPLRLSDAVGTVRLASTALPHAARALNTLTEQGCREAGYGIHPLDRAHDFDFERYRANHGWSYWTFNGAHHHGAYAVHQGVVFHGSGGGWAAVNFYCVRNGDNTISDEFHSWP
jgi:hypothetical protein